MGAMDATDKCWEAVPSTNGRSGQLSCSVKEQVCRPAGDFPPWSFHPQMDRSCLILNVAIVHVNSEFVAIEVLSSIEL